MSMIEPLNFQEMSRNPSRFLTSQKLRKHSVDSKNSHIVKDNLLRLATNELYDSQIITSKLTNGAEYSFNKKIDESHQEPREDERSDLDIVQDDHSYSTPKKSFHQQSWNDLGKVQETDREYQGIRNSPATRLNASVNMNHDNLDQSLLEEQKQLNKRQRTPIMGPVLYSPMPINSQLFASQRLYQTGQLLVRTLNKDDPNTFSAINLRPKPSQAYFKDKAKKFGQMYNTIKRTTPMQQKKLDFARDYLDVMNRPEIVEFLQKQKDQVTKVFSDAVSIYKQSTKKCQFLLVCTCKTRLTPR